MKKITYVGPFSEVEFQQGAVWRTVKKGEAVDVPDDVADSLLEQPDNWAAEKPKTTTKKAQPGEED